MRLFECSRPCLRPLSQPCKLKLLPPPHPIPQGLDGNVIGNAEFRFGALMGGGGFAAGGGGSGGGGAPPGAAGLCGFPAAAGAEVRPTTDQIPAFAAALLTSQDPAALLDVTTQFRKLLSIERTPPIDAVIAAGVVPRIVQLLALDAQPRLQFEACWTLANIAAGTSANTNEVIHAGAVSAFVRLLSSPHEDVREQAVWALGTIAGDGVPTRNVAIAAGVIPPLLACITPGATTSFLKNVRAAPPPPPPPPPSPSLRFNPLPHPHPPQATWTLSNLCRGKPPPSLPTTRALLPKLTELITSDDRDVQQDALWALSYLSDGEEDRLWAFLEAGALPRIVQLLTSPHLEVVTPALRAIGNIATGDDLLTQAVLNEGALHGVLALLANTRRAVRKEACWLVSNVCAGTPGQIQMVFDCNLLPALIHQLRQGEPDVQREACWALSNATTGGTARQLYDLVRFGLVPPLKRVLECATMDPRVLTVAIEALQNILAKPLPPGVPEAGDGSFYLNVMEQAGVPDAVSRLLDSSSGGLYNMADGFMKRWFPNWNGEGCVLRFEPRALAYTQPHVHTLHARTHTIIAPAAATMGRGTASTRMSRGGVTTGAGERGTLHRSAAGGARAPGRENGSRWERNRQKARAAAASTARRSACLRTAGAADCAGLGCERRAAAGLHSARARRCGARGGGCAARVRRGRRLFWAGLAALLRLNRLCWPHRAWACRRRRPWARPVWARWARSAGLCWRFAGVRERRSATPEPVVAFLATPHRRDGALRPACAEPPRRRRRCRSYHPTRSRRLSFLAQVAMTRLGSPALRAAWQSRNARKQQGRVDPLGGGPPQGRSLAMGASVGRSHWPGGGGVGARGARRGSRPRSRSERKLAAAGGGGGGGAACARRGPRRGRGGGWRAARGGRDGTARRTAVGRAAR